MRQILFYVCMSEPHGPFSLDQVVKYQELSD